MKNVKMVVDKDSILTIKVDLNENYGESKSGKSIIIASTEGNVALDGELSNIKIGLNVYKQLYSGRDWQPVDQLGSSETLYSDNVAYISLKESMIKVFSAYDLHKCCKLYIQVFNSDPWNDNQII